MSNQPYHSNILNYMKKLSYQFSGLLLIISIVFLSYSCKKDPTLAELETVAVTSVTRTSASTGGNISNDGGSSVSSRGVCWNTSENPTTNNNKTSNGSGSGAFTSELTQLTPGEKYYVRAYATNEAGTSYGDQLSFTTAEIQLATLSTAAIGSITANSAIGGGNITDDGGGSITGRGICWSTTLSPTIQDNHTDDGSGTGTYSSSMTGLSPETYYYVRSYAINSAGTAYGNEISFSTGKITDADGNEYTTVEIGTQVWFVEDLETTTLYDGTKLKAENDIPLVTDNTEWSNLSSSAYCWYNNDQETYGSNGTLYNWYAVNSGKLCPDGWHVATNSDWIVMIQFLIDNGYNYDGSTNTPISENKVAKALASSSGWTSSANTGAVGNNDFPGKINVTGFTGKPSGYRRYDGEFRDYGNYGYWWTSTSYSTEFAHYYEMIYSWDQVDYYEWDKRNGYSVRCVKD